MTSININNEALGDVRPPIKLSELNSTAPMGVVFQACDAKSDNQLAVDARLACEYGRKMEHEVAELRRQLAYTQSVNDQLNKEVNSMVLRLIRVQICDKEVTSRYQDETVKPVDMVVAEVIQDLRDQLSTVTRERDELRDSLQRISNNLNEPVILDRIKHMDDTPLNRSYGASHLCKELAQTRQGFTELGEKYDVAKRQLEWLEKQLHGSDGYIATARELRVEIGERAKERDAEAVRADAAIAEANDARTKLAAAEAERERMQCGHLRSSIVTSIESNSNWCGECDMHSRLSDAIQMEKHNKEQWDREKERRVYYQDIVYAVCNLLDKHLGYLPGQGLVTGTVETPSTMVSDTLEKVLLRCKQLDKAEADAAAMRRTMTENESRLKDVIRRIGVSTTTGWITHELNHVLLDIPSGTAGRELLDRHKAKLAAKDAEIEQERKLSRSCMSQNARLVRKSRTAKTALFEHYRGKIDPAWFGEKSELYKYRTTANPSGVIWRTSDGKSCKASMVGHAWITATAYSSWQECCDDKRTYPCNADGTPLAKSDDDAALLRKLRELLQGKTISYHSGTAGVCVSLTHAQTYIDTLIAIRDGGK